MEKEKSRTANLPHKDHNSSSLLSNKMSANPEQKRSSQGRPNRNGLKTNQRSNDAILINSVEPQVAKKKQNLPPKEELN